VKVVFHQMTQSEADEIAEWRYEPPYSFYGADAESSALDARGALVGFEFEQRGEELELGLGLRPDLPGRGLGFNARAIRVYERAGFRPVRDYDHETNGGVHRFLELARPAE
jgi:ribosomal-protein-alanine N-acetyltransferase